ncbi:uncharacterized protein B0I36DRAFT_312131 [Microdochium trichocladiopsis]|uniref:Extracellular membrane protein CFEM domain-containing protein n=1 Tax=Microdochium trichocladiopsis TaxID=1682393 RepID=A0A9P8YJF1_9PEZI|nr:uncharacterized protein B0I36DRAFT_312131 [Microdochium trichocladiopsis]KAH7041108.1 hypothetical protein B0I36DRAFT_312131 [Microdochium trichocladiopsis]
MRSFLGQGLPRTRFLALDAVAVAVALFPLDLAAALKNDFSAYPQGSQACLYSAADSAACTGSTGAELNQCLCTNKGNFVYNTASCVAKDSPGDLNTVYATLVSNCQGTGVTLAVSQDAFMAAAAAATATTSSTTPTAATSTSASTASSSASPTTSSPASPASSDDALSTGAKIGIGVGVGFGAIALALAAWFIWAYSRRRQGPMPLSSSDQDHRSWHPPGSSAFSSSTPAPSEWANDNKQTDAVELGATPWRPPGNPAATEQPLLSELGGDMAYHNNNTTGYQDYAPAGANGAYQNPHYPPHGQPPYGSPHTQYAGDTRGHPSTSPVPTNDGSWTQSSSNSQSYTNHPYSPPSTY